MSCSGSSGARALGGLLLGGVLGTVLVALVVRVVRVTVAVLTVTAVLAVRTKYKQLIRKTHKLNVKKYLLSLPPPRLSGDEPSRGI